MVTGIIEGDPQELSDLDRQLHALLAQKTTPPDAEIRALIKRGASVHSSNKLGETPLHLAAMHGHVAAIHILIKHKAQIESTQLHKMTPLLYAARYNQPAAIQALMEHKANLFAVDNQGGTALHAAACYHAADALEVLLATPLQSTINQRDTGDCTPLLDACVKISAKGNKQYSDTEQARINKTFQLLLKAGADATLFDSGRATPLTLCADSDQHHITKLLIPLSGDINHVDELGNTALHYAARNGHTETVRQLLEASADPALRNHKGRGPLLNAAEGYLPTISREERIETIRLLARWGGEINQPDHKGNLPISTALCSRFPDLPLAMLDLGARIPPDQGDSVSATKRIKQANQRWAQTLGANPPNLAELAPHDLICFANIGRLNEALRPQHWQGRAAQLTKLLCPLPPALTKQAMLECPGLATFLGAPSSQIASREHEGMQQPTISKAK